MKAQEAQIHDTTIMMLTLLLLEHLLSSLLSEWTDPEKELRALASVINADVLQRIAAQPGFVVRACKVLSAETVSWAASVNIRVQLLLETTETAADGTQAWYQNGQRHRDGDRPAIVWLDGDHAWYQNGQRHRDEDRPAIVGANGTQLWYRNGQLHRDGDLPAVVQSDGYQAWYHNGQLHRNGPAIVWADGSQVGNVTQIWYRNGQLHRDGAAAIVRANGSQEWYHNGQRYRDGPAIIWADGRQDWYKNGKRQRNDS